MCKKKARSYLRAFSILFFTITFIKFLFLGLEDFTNVLKSSIDCPGGGRLVFFIFPPNLPNRLVQLLLAIMAPKSITLALTNSGNAPFSPPF